MKRINRRQFLFSSAAFLSATMPCAAYHISYSNEGFYEGTDPAIPKDKKGHPHKKTFHHQLMERTWAPGLTFHSIYETKKPQVP